MNKRELANDKVRKKLEDALFALMAQKHFSAITVTDLVTESGVARSSYYRNFDSKEAIIEAYMNRQRLAVSNAIAFSKTANDLFMADKLAISLAHYRTQKARLVLLYDQGFGTALLDEMNQFAGAILGDMPRSSVTRYKLYFLAGAMFNMTIQWLREDAIETPEALAAEFTRMLQHSMASLLQPATDNLGYQKGD